LDIPRIFNNHRKCSTASITRSHPKSSILSARRCVWKGGPECSTSAAVRGRCCAPGARDYGVIGTGIDMSQLYTEQAKRRAEKLGVADQVKFIHGDAAGFVSDEKASVAACLGATWIAGGVVGTIEASGAEPPPRRIILIGEPFWRAVTADGRCCQGGVFAAQSLRLSPPSRTSRVFPGHLGYDVVEMVLADPRQLGQIRGRPKWAHHAPMA